MDLDVSTKEKMVIHVGGEFNILAYYWGKPAPQITWDRDGYSVPPEAVIETTANSSSVTLKKCSRKDKGTYTLTAKNEAGEMKKAVIVDVLGK